MHAQKGKDKLNRGRTNAKVKHRTNKTRVITNKTAGDEVNSSWLSSEKTSTHKEAKIN